jgi:hypothetical protein
MFLNYLGKPSKYLPSCMVVWGALSVATGVFIHLFCGFAIISVYRIYDQVGGLVFTGQTVV